MTALGDEAARAQRIDILKYQIDEIKASAVQSGEEEKLVERRHVLMAAERIKNALADGFSRLDSDDGASGAVADAGAVRCPLFHRSAKSTRSFTNGCVRCR